MTDRERDRNAARRLAILRHAREVTGNVSRTCRYYGITRQAYYMWVRRYEESGLEGLRDRSRRPLVSPNATKAEVVGKIVYLRKSYHGGALARTSSAVIALRVADPKQRLTPRPPAHRTPGHSVLLPVPAASRRAG